ncbi:MAG TPA: hypothetical protein VGG44_07270 [Tepidisphaeraceae bacterium]
MHHSGRVSLAIFALLGLSFLVVRTGAATTRPSGAQSATAGSDGEDVVADTNQAVAQWRQYPLLPMRSISQVVHFTESGGLLAADWPILESGPVNGRVPLSDLPGDAIILSHSIPRQHTPIWPMFEYYEVSGGNPVGRHLQVLNTPIQLQVIQDIKSLNELTTISLIETLDETDTEPVTLRVQTIRDTQPALNLVLSAPTLPALRQEHPREFEQYLRPVFRQFHQDRAVFGVEPQVAWQAMGDVWQPPADLQAKILPLIAQLDAVEYSDRARAQAELRKIGEPAALYLFSADRRNWSAEQKARTDKLLAEFFPLSAQQAKALGSDVNFLLDCLDSDDADLRVATLKHLNRALGRDVKLNLDVPAAERVAEIARLRKELGASAATRNSSK